MHAIKIKPIEGRVQPERFKEIERIYCEAIELEPARRAGFLDTVCRGNVELHREKHEDTKVSKENDTSWEIVLETIEPAEVAVVKSLLDASGILYLTRGEDQFDAFRGAFRGTVFSDEGRPVIFLVPADMVEDARLLLRQ